MTAELGAFALILALTLSLAQTTLSALGGARRAPVLTGAGSGAALAAFLATGLAFAILIHAFVVSDFSVANVAENSHTEKPLLYKVAGAWGSHEGSILLWCTVLTGYGAAVALFGQGLPLRLRSYVLAVQGSLGTVFLAYTVLASNPLARLANPPVEGRSLNPLLQDPALAAHPPFLYMGYVGFSVVFSFAVAALIEGRVDTAWARWVRPWTLAAWSLLTIGITLGAFWAYYELGWGGWWGWDPVENASFMPWLVGAALLHSAIVTEKRGALPGWTVFLGLMAFTFSMLGAFLVRSGVLTSVHAFAVDPARGVLLLTIVAVFAGSAFALFAWRGPTLQPGGVFAPISRESGIVLNNILISAATATVVLGTLYPLLRQAIGGENVSVGPPFFDMTFTPLMSLVILLIPIGSMLSWKRADILGVLQRLWWCAALAVLAGLAFFALISPRKVVACFGMAAALWCIMGALAELMERTRMFRAPWEEVRRRFTGLPRGAWGMTLAHIGIGVFVLGAAFETSWRLEAAETLPMGGQMKLGSAYVVHLDKVGPVDGPNYTAERGSIRVLDAKGKLVCSAEPERRTYAPDRQTTSEVALCLKPLDDIYVVLGERRESPDGSVSWLVRTFFNPWVRLLLFGPILMALGGFVSLSDRRLRLAAPQRKAAPAARPPEPLPAE